MASAYSDVIDNIYSKQNRLLEEPRGNHSGYFALRFYLVTYPYHTLFIMISRCGMLSMTVAIEI